MDALTEVWSFLAQGAYSLGIIAGCSLIAIVVAIDRLISLWGEGEKARRLSDAVVRSLYRGDKAEARAACERSPSAFADVLLAALSRHGTTSREVVAQAAERERIQVGVRLRSRLWILGTIGAVAPFIGLFGTVIGIMNAFSDLAAQPGGGFAVVASGISEALIATAAGIGVAIEAVVLFNYFSSRLTTLSLLFKVQAEEVVELLFLSPQQEAAEPGAAAEGGAG